MCEIGKGELIAIYKTYEGWTDLYIRKGDRLEYAGSLLAELIGSMETRKAKIYALGTVEEYARLCEELGLERRDAKGTLLKGG